VILKTLDLKLGTNINIALFREQNHFESSLFSINVSPELDSLNVCTYGRFPSSLSPSPFLNSVSLDAYLGIDLLLSERIRLSILIGKYLQPINNAGFEDLNNRTHNLPHKYRPSYGKLALTLVLGKKENLRETKKKFLFNKTPKDLDTNEHLLESK